MVGYIWTLKQPPPGCISANTAPCVCLTFPQRSAKPLNRSTASPVLAQVCYKAEQSRSFISVHLCRASLKMSLLMASMVTLSPLLLVSFFTSSLSALAVVHAMACAALQSQLVFGVASSCHCHLRPKENAPPSVKSALLREAQSISGWRYISFLFYL